MRGIRGGHVLLALVILCVVGTLTTLRVAQAAEDWKWVTAGQAPQGRWTAGFRAGFSILSQEIISNTSTSVGPAINTQAMYGLNKWINLGLMLEWERHTVDVERPKADLGTVNTVSLLPTIEIRPGHFGRIIPYGSAGIGVNVNSFSESSGVSRTSLDNTFAFRLAGGADYPLNPHLALNTELAWKRNRGGFETGGTEGNFEASSMNFLFGARYTF